MKIKYAFTLYEKKVGKVPLGLKGTPVLLLSDFEEGFCRVGFWLTADIIGSSEVNVNDKWVSESQLRKIMPFVDWDKVSGVKK